MEKNKVLIVNSNDEVLDEMDKMQAHKIGVLHRAFSVFIFNPLGEMLIHQRAYNKYHGGGLWTNACCSHPQLNECITRSAQERLNYEMGIDSTITKSFSFTYKTPVENNLIEHEFDHVFTGVTIMKPKPNKHEVENFAWVCTEKLEQHINRHPKKFTQWFKMAYPIVIKKQYISLTNIGTCSSPV